MWVDLNFSATLCMCESEIHSQQRRLMDLLGIYALKLIFCIGCGSSFTLDTL